MACQLRVARLASLSCPCFALLQFRALSFIVPKYHWLCMLVDATVVCMQPWWLGNNKTQISPIATCTPHHHLDPRTFHQTQLAIYLFVIASAFYHTNCEVFTLELMHTVPNPNCVSLSSSHTQTRATPTMCQGSTSTHIIINIQTWQ